MNDFLILYSKKNCWSSHFYQKYFKYLWYFKNIHLIAVTYRLFDLNIDIGKILGDIGGLLFSNQNAGNDTNINEDTGQGELGNIFL